MSLLDPGLLQLDSALRGSARIPAISRGPRAEAREIAALGLAGAGAALLTAYADLGLGLPGHHILFALFPMALGLALVPRRLGGSIMGASGAGTLALLGAAGVHLPGPGALVGFAVSGPLLDLALRHGRAGWRLYGAFVAAGALTNVLAFFARGVTKYLGWGGMGGGRRFAEWLPVAVWTYVAAGILAGLLSAAVWFHFRARR